MDVLWERVWGKRERGMKVLLWTYLHNPTEYDGIWAQVWYVAGVHVATNSQVPTSGYQRCGRRKKEDL